jgi:hypothetical protein
MSERKKIIKRKPFIIYYELNDNTYRGYCSKLSDGTSNNDHEITHYINLPRKDNNIYEMTIMKDKNGELIYEANDDGLIKCVKDFYDDNNVLKKNPTIKNFNYAHHKSDSSACKAFYKTIQGSDLFKHEIIDMNESKWIRECSNNASTYCKKGVYENCYSYDFSMNHPSILASVHYMIPTKKGVSKHINNLDKIEFGFYKLKVRSTNPNFEKIFKFSKYDTYTYYDLLFLKENEEELEIEYRLKRSENDNKFNVFGDNDDGGKINDPEYINCYIYDKDCLVEGKKYFGKWYNCIKYLKKTYPKNKLVKKLTSKLWGLLCQANTKNYSLEEINEKNLDVGDYSHEYMISDYISPSNENKEPYYKLTNTKQPFFYNIRIKSFLSSYARCKLARLAMENLDNVIRTNMDCVTFTQPLSDELVNSYDNLTFEEKSSGSNVKWEGLNKMIRL